jgi:hypothetical protein
MMRIPGLQPSEQTLIAPPMTSPIIAGSRNPLFLLSNGLLLIPGILNGRILRAPRPAMMATIPAKIFQ